ncbi:MAG: hypothetical protein ACLFUZ_02530 [Candidatus Micrarchaeia archaeon]
MGGAMKRKAAKKLEKAYQQEQQIAQGANPFKGQELTAERQEQAREFCERFGPVIERAIESTSALPEMREELQEVRKEAKESLPTDAEAAMMIFGGSAMGIFAVPISGANDIMDAISPELAAQNIGTFKESLETVETATEAPSELRSKHEEFERSMVRLNGAVRRFENAVVSAARAIESGNPKRIKRSMDTLEKKADAVEKAGKIADSKLRIFSKSAAKFHLATGVVSEFTTNAESAIASTVAIAVGIGALGLAAKGAVGAARASSYGRMEGALAEAGAHLSRARYVPVGVRISSGSIKGIGGKLAQAGSGAFRIAKSGAKKGGQIAPKGIRRSLDITEAEQTISEAYNEAQEYTAQNNAQSLPRPPKAKGGKEEKGPETRTREPEAWEEHDYSRGGPQSRME